jgi:hypothetical protein
MPHLLVGAVPVGLGGATSSKGIQDFHRMPERSGCGEEQGSVDSGFRPAPPIADVIPDLSWG